jgi:DNA-directed RNA polymerase subunit M/transcription elongation factor TFIIS
VHRTEIAHHAKERTVIVKDVRADPTLPCTRDAVCPSCGHDEAVFFSAATDEGMTLYFTCVECGHRWRDYV